jgi:L-alanine-DL-glutamate epimerase-like enolase superfamily enzyme
MRTVVRAETWPIRGGFRIARGARTDARVLVVELQQEQAVGRGECVPYARYGESIRSVAQAIEQAARGWADVATARAALRRMARGAARNALDCALWDLEAKLAGKPAWSLLGLDEPPESVSTMRTVSVGAPTAMYEAAREFAHAEVIKVKVDGGADLERIEAVHAAAPQAELVVDPNESWSPEQTCAWLPELRRFGVGVLEQPLPEGADSALEAIERSVPICADESFHDRSSFARVQGRYDMVNVKLDKAGGISEALTCVRRARQLGIDLMVGCMVSTSLAIEPALLLTAFARYVDLDGPILLESDRTGARHERDVGLLRASPSVWGHA